jgi:hypothetical protein
MKKIVFYLGLSVLGVFVMSSCDDETERSHASYGVIKNVVSDKNYEILTDKGNTLVVTKSHSTQEIAENKRVLVNFDLKSDKESGKNVYEVEVNGFYNLLSKPLVSESFILENEESRRDSIGNDPFNGVDAWFGGDYININFEAYFDRYSNEKHLINLVYDDTDVSSDTLYLSLYQNAFDKGGLKYNGSYYERGVARCSFKLSDLLPDDVNSKPVKLTWREYRSGFNVVECSDWGIFKKDSHSNSEKSTPNIGVDNSVMVK